MKTIVHLVRHGEVENPQQILYGRLPGYHLSQRGQEQATDVAKAFADHNISHLVSSPLERARETAQPIADLLGLPIDVDERLTEAANDFEGQKIVGADGVLRRPTSWAKLRNPWTPSWGESYHEIISRMVAAAHGAAKRAEGGEAICVSHQLPIWMLRRFLQGQRLIHDPRKRQCSYASVTSLVFSSDWLVDVVYSEPAGPTEAGMAGA